MKKKANKNRKKSDSSNMKGWLKDIGLFVVGTLFGLCVVNWFVKLLPGPQQDLRVAETGGAAENKGCMYYSVLLTSREPIEYTYAKILLPNTITAQEFAVFDPLIEQAKISRFTIFRGGKDQNGKCIINSAEKNDNHTAIGEIPDDPVHAYFSGSILKINAFKLPPKSMILGIVATNIKSTNVFPIPTISAEGYYEYIKFGQNVRKPLQVTSPPASFK